MVHLRLDFHALIVSQTCMKIKINLMEKIFEQMAHSVSIPFSQIIRANPHVIFQTSRGGENDHLMTSSRELLKCSVHWRLWQARHGVCLAVSLKSTVSV